MEKSLDLVLFGVQHEHNLQEFITLNKQFVRDMDELGRAYNKIIKYKNTDQIHTFLTRARRIILDKTFETMTLEYPYDTFYRLASALSELLYITELDLNKSLRLVRHSKIKLFNTDLDEIIRKYDYYLHGIGEMTIVNNEPISDFIALSNGQFAIIGDDRYLRIFSTEGSESSVIFEEELKGMTYQEKMIFNGAYLIIPITEGIAIYKDGIITNIFEKNTTTVGSFPNSDEVIIGFMDGHLEIWRIGDTQPTSELVGHTNSITSIITYKDKIITGSRDTTIRVWNNFDSSVLSGHKKDIRGLLIKGDKLISFDPQVIKIWDLHSGKHLQDLSNHTWGTRIVSTLNAKEIVNISSYMQGELTVWNLDTGKARGVRGKSKVTLFTVLPNSTIAVIKERDKNIIFIWNPQTGVFEKQIHLDSAITALGVFEDRLYAICNNNSIRFFG